MARGRRVADRPAATSGLVALGLAALLPGLTLLTALSAVTAAPAGATVRPLETSSSTVWLCRPGQAADPCAYSTATTTVTAQGTTSVASPAPTTSAHAFDCFYVYPTSSTETGTNSNLAIQPAEIGAAVAQASQFSQVCNVWAPMYRQATEAALKSGAAFRPSVIATAYDSLLAAWKDYLAHDNDGRPIIFIGHSQGAAMLIKLLRAQVDPSPTLRKKMVSAIILGGNVQVQVGRDVGGSFRNIPTCGSVSQTGCVIAYSSFGSPPPRRAMFGRPGQGVSLQSGQTTKTGQQVACVNPVTFSSQAGALQPLFPRRSAKVPGLKVHTEWVSFPGLYTAQCEQADGASWLQVDTTSVPGDPRPTVKVTPALGASWGYHLADVNLALGNLVSDVSSEETAYRP
jgi:hypothetical protein